LNKLDTTDWIMATDSSQHLLCRRSWRANRPHRLTMIAGHGCTLQRLLFGPR
jgi:hypothetical protein